MTRREFGSAAGLSIAAALATNGSGAELPVNIGSRRELFIDGELIATMHGADLRPGIPVDAGVALKLDRPWEGAFSNYTTILPHQSGFRIYYRGVPVSGQDGNLGEVTACAESPDGIRWTRPDLNLFEVKGSKTNNVILANDPPFSTNFTPFLDRRPGTPDSERYKALAGVHKTGLFAFVSSDGIQWKRLRERPALAPPEQMSLDSQNVAFWSDHENKYVLYYRTWKKIGATGFRWVSRAVSDNFFEWTPTGEMSYGGAPPEHLYTNQTSAYFRAPHIYTGICARFMPGRQVLTDAQAQELRVDPAYFKDCSDAVLVTSRGGNLYTRAFMDAFLRPGVGLENWVSRSNYPALNLMQTGPATMSFLVNRNYGQPTAYLRRFELRLDGLASLHAGYAGGEIVTKPVIFDGSQLELNYSTSAPGSVRIELQDASGHPLPGFSLGESRELIGDEIESVYSWKSGSELSALRGKPVRLRIALKDANLYSFRFRT